MTFVSRLDEFRARRDAAIDAGLQAAALELAGEIKQRLLQGYKTGAFVTGTVANSVAVSEPEDGDDGREIRVGSNLDYALFWEIGHHNIFTRQYERVEVWRPTAADMSPQLAQLFADTVKSRMEG